ncbi:MAG: 16S rRNA (guanine(527)-N(7))-methyltransferase RsmG [Bacteroidales bacterium]|nr:16S rRNA (guanine(527)-N(7))-methyltransferase RsmG [Bacteroidales bacterium]
MQTINKYFDSLDQHQKQQFSQLEDLYIYWNNKINVISRKDIRNLYTNHVLHSLSIARVIAFKPGTAIIDVGTGGGFPGIPLAIFFPEANFLLVDSVTKKLIVVNAVIQALQLSNCTVRNNRIEDLEDKVDFIVSRAVTELSVLYAWTRKNIKPEGFNELPNGLLVLKGGDLRSELAGFKSVVSIFNLKNFFNERFFESKKLIFLPG